MIKNFAGAFKITILHFFDPVRLISFYMAYPGKNLSYATANVSLCGIMLPDFVVVKSSVCGSFSVTQALFAWLIFVDNFSIVTTSYRDCSEERQLQ